MKKILVTILLSLVGMCSQISAQSVSRNQRISREELAELQAKHIAQDLALDDKTSEQFIATFCQYKKEIWALGPRLKRGKASTDAETEQAIKRRFEMSEKILEIRQKYYKQYSDFLTQSQIQRMYELEKFMSKRFARKIMRNKPSRNTNNDN